MPASLLSGASINMKRGSPLRKMSRKMARHNAEYQKAKKIYMKTHPMCEACQCHEAESLHHKRGRGIYLCEVQYFMSVCNLCHSKIETFKTWAFQMGYRLDRIGHE